MGFWRRFVDSGSQIFDITPLEQYVQDFFWKTYLRSI